MPDFREVMEAERTADESAALAHKLAEEGHTAHARVQMLDAIRAEIRAQGMRFDRAITEASRT